MPSSAEPSVAVVGAGIGGLAAAAFLHRAGLPVTVYEQASALKEVGAGLVAAPNLVRLLRRLGVMDAFLERAVAIIRRVQGDSLEVANSYDLLARALRFATARPEPEAIVALVAREVAARPESGGRIGF